MWRQAVVQKLICNDKLMAISLKFYNLLNKVGTVKPLSQHLWRRKRMLMDTTELVPIFATAPAASKTTLILSGKNLLKNNRLATLI